MLHNSLPAFLFVALCAQISFAGTGQGAFRQNFDDRIGRGESRLPEHIKQRMQQVRKSWERTQNAASEQLDEIEVLVRVYDNWQGNRTEYEEVYLRLERGVLYLDDIAMNDSAAVIVLGSDQEDRTITSLLGVEPLLLHRNGSWDFSRRRTRRAEKICTFKDAVGNPIPLAECEIFEHRAGASQEKSTGSTFVLSELGQGRYRYGSDKKVSYYIVLSHPDYGTHRLKVPQSYHGYELRIPVVLEGTEAYERSIRGYIVDEADNAISNASIVCGLYVPEGQNMVMGLATYKVFTDEQGWFHMYLPLKDEAKSPKLIPPNSRYYVKVDPPKELHLAPFVGYIPNDGEHIVKLDQHTYFRRIVFEDAEGAITDLNRLKRIRLEVWPEQAEFSLDYMHGDWRNGGYFPLGRFNAKLYSGDEHIEFEPIKVTPDSPEELVFRVGKGITYFGQVVNGVTGRPMEGVIVIDSRGRTDYEAEDLSDLTGEQWDKLHSLASEFHLDKQDFRKTVASPYSQMGVAGYSDQDAIPVQDESVRRLAQLYQFTKGVRTDPNGRFELSFEGGDAFDSLMAFEEDYLGIECIRQFLVPGPEGRTRVPVIPLFPAGKVRVELRIDLPGPGLPGARPFWAVDQNDLPPWAAEPPEPTFDDAVIWPDDDSNIYLSQDAELPATCFYVSRDPAVILLGMVVDLVVFGRISLPEALAAIQQSYTASRAAEPLAIEPNEIAVWLDESPPDSGYDLDRVPTFLEIEQGSQFSFTDKRSVLPNDAHTFYVPAGLKLNLSFYLEHNPDYKWAAAIVPQTVNLKQGELLDLGGLKIPPAPRIFVKAVDSAGACVRDVPVQHWFEKVGLLQTKNTDENGLVGFYSRYNRKGKFVVGNENDGRGLYTSLSYEIRSEEEIGTEYTLTVSERIISHLSKQGFFTN